MLKNLNLRTIIALGLIFAFLVNIFGPMPLAQAQLASPGGGDFRLPAPGVIVHLSPEFNPAILKGIKVHPDNPFRFDFVLDKGDNQLSNNALKDESSKLIKYFLASLTIPEKDLWVNLSPYEKNRIVPESFGQTEMGRDLLAEDYMLKQITASLIYPEDEIGKKFWKRIYEEAAKKFGTTNIPVNTFNKVWIVPEKAVVYENTKAGTAYVVEAKLKVMLEQDYLAMSKHAYVGVPEGGASPASAGFGEHAGETRGQDPNINALGSQIIREIVIPELTKEVNEGKNFAQLRQVYNSLILATWYKKKIKDSILAQVYANKNKISGLSFPNASIGNPEHIYQQYLQAFKKGAYNYIKEEQDPITQDTAPRKYFSGGVDNTHLSDVAMTVTADPAQLPTDIVGQVIAVNLVPHLTGISDRAMAAQAAKNKQIKALEEEIETIYQGIDPRNYRYISSFNVPFITVAEELLLSESNFNLPLNHEDTKLIFDDTIMELKRSGISSKVSQSMEYVEALKKLLSFIKEDSEQSRRFVLALSKLEAWWQFQLLKKGMDAHATGSDLPDNPLPDKDFLDIASGVDFILLIPYFKGKNKYYAVDTSYFVVNFLEEVKRLLGADNIQIIQEDIRKLTMASKSLGIIRAKNVYKYVDDFDSKLPEILGWLDEGGVFVLSVDPDFAHRKDALMFAKRIAPQLKGWGFDFKLAPGDQHLDQMIFKKPRSGEQLTSTVTLESYERTIAAKERMRLKQEGKDQAASNRLSVDLVTSQVVTPPFSSIDTAKITVPSTLRARSSAGYSGCGVRIGVGFVSGASPAA